MFVLLFIVLLIQSLTHWIFGPLAGFITNVLEVRLLTGIAFLVFIFLFSRKNT